MYEAEAVEDGVGCLPDGNDMGALRLIGHTVDEVVLDLVVTVQSAHALAAECYVLAAKESG